MAREHVVVVWGPRRKERCRSWLCVGLSIHEAQGVAAGPGLCMQPPPSESCPSGMMGRTTVGLSQTATRAGKLCLPLNSEDVGPTSI